MDDLSRDIDRARQGDRDAFGRVVEASWSQSLAFARMVLGRHGDAEDVVQESYLVAWQRLDQLRSPDAFRSWFRQIVYRSCLARLDDTRRGPTAELRDVHAGPPNQATGDIERALGALSARQRAVIFLGEIEGRSDTEIAAALGLGRVTIRTHRARARARMKELFEVEDR